MKEFLSENVNGILGTVIVHLLVFIFLLFVQIGKIREYKNEQILIEFDDEMVPIEEIITPEDYYANYNEATNNMASSGIRSLATNISDNEISTEDYEKQVMEELGIETLKPDIPSDQADEFTLEEQKTETESPPKVTSNRIVRDNTVVTYELQNRWHKNIYIPAYKCKGGGTVVLNIEVSQQGNVNTASVVKALSTIDQCLIDEATSSALQATFNSGPSLPVKQQGIITFTFIAQ